MRRHIAIDAAGNVHGARVGLPRCCAGVLALGVVLSSACAADEGEARQGFSLSFKASERDQPLPGVRIKLADEALGETDDEGLLNVVIRAHEGDILAVDAECPERFSLVEAPATVLVHRVNTLGNAAGAEDRGLRTVVRCEPKLWEQLIIVRTEGASVGGLPVRLNGAEVGRLGAGGTTHLVVRGVEQRPWVITLNTDSRPDLIPQNPQLSASIDRTQTVIQLRQQFSVERVKKKVRKVRRIERPQRIE